MKEERGTSEPSDNRPNVVPKSFQKRPTLVPKLSQTRPNIYSKSSKIVCGAILVALGVVVELRGPFRRRPSWRSLRLSWGRLGVLLGPPEAFLGCLGALLGCLGAPWALSWAVLGPWASWTRFGRRASHPGIILAVLGPSWAVLGEYLAVFERSGGHLLPRTVEGQRY